MKVIAKIFEFLFVIIIAVGIGLIFNNEPGLAIALLAFFIIATKGNTGSMMQKLEELTDKDRIATSLEAARANIHDNMKEAREMFEAMMKNDAEKKQALLATKDALDAVSKNLEKKAPKSKKAAPKKK